MGVKTDREGPLTLELQVDGNREPLLERSGDVGQIDPLGLALGILQEVLHPRHEGAHAAGFLLDDGDLGGGFSPRGPLQERGLQQNCGQGVLKLVAEGARSFGELQELAVLDQCGLVAARSKPKGPDERQEAGPGYGTQGARDRPRQEPAGERRVADPQEQVALAAAAHHRAGLFFGVVLVPEAHPWPKRLQHLHEVDPAVGAGADSRRARQASRPVEHLGRAGSPLAQPFPPRPVHREGADSLGQLVRPQPAFEATAKQLVSQAFQLVLEGHLEVGPLLADEQKPQGSPCGQKEEEDQPGKVLKDSHFPHCKAPFPESPSRS